MGAAIKLEPTVERFVSAPVRKMLIDGKWVEAANDRAVNSDFHEVASDLVEDVLKGGCQDAGISD